MFEPGEVVYAFTKDIHPPKPKYFVTIYRDENLRIVTCFTTTKPRVEIPFHELNHGYVRKDGEIIGYFFHQGVVVGVDPSSGLDFSFPRDCVIPFDYGVRQGTKDRFLAVVDNPVVVCNLSHKEYIDIVYAMYRSSRTDLKYKPFLEKILQNLH